jgi:hypothetical protein
MPEAFFPGVVIRPQSSTILSDGGHKCAEKMTDGVLYCRPSTTSPPWRRQGAGGAVGGLGRITTAAFDPRFRQPCSRRQAELAGETIPPDGARLVVDQLFHDECWDCIAPSTTGS